VQYFSPVLTGRDLLSMYRSASLVNRAALFLLAIPCFMPGAWRLLQKGITEPIGLLSDFGLGMVVFLLAVVSPRWLRMIPMLLWAVFQAGAQELFAAMHRLPVRQDISYLVDPTFMKNSTAGLNLNCPYFAAFILLSAVLASVFPVTRPGSGCLRKCLAVTVALLVFQGFLSRHHDSTGIAARYNPLHWFIADSVAATFHPAAKPLPAADLPPGLREIDLRGKPLLLQEGAARNVLIVILEGVTGLYHPEIREAMAVPPGSFEMKGLAENTAEGMLIPDFITHSHQTIRGLYSILCGDFSKLSFETPKAFELQENLPRARECLPAQMAGNGWETHFLQGAGLTFMGKDLVMPNIGFQHVHGEEWFTDPDRSSFIWGVDDHDFFRGARKYVDDLRAADRPWMLTLLTVGTHQPYAAPDELAAAYPSRKLATIAILDEAVAEFIRGLRQDGVLEDTLVIITSDESHGAELAEWVSSWGIGIVLAPEQERLPRLKAGTFGLVDITASILDYLDLAMPPSIIGRSFFRDYAEPREMVAYTAGKLRWHTAGNLRYECTRSGDCRAGPSPSLIGFPPADLTPVKGSRAGELFAMAAALDHRLTGGNRSQQLRFANGEIRRLPEKIVNEWTDNLAGAQYLDFPENSNVHVSIRVRALQTPETGVRLHLSLRQYERLVQDIAVPQFPVLHAGEEGKVEFHFSNPASRQAFSFHLVGEGKNGEIRLEEFNVTVNTVGS
jgi:hypothetical protein